MARAVQQYALKATQLWLNGNDQQTLDQNQSLMQNIYFYIAHVPFTAPQSEYPGLKTYLSVMNKYEPKYAEDEVALQGWESAALFAAGVKAAGNNLTQANVIAQTNKLTNFTSGGIATVTNWSQAHTINGFPGCSAFVKVKGTHFVPAVAKGPHVFVCFAQKVNLKNPQLATPPVGTPGT
jgi:hypothetical protein